MNLKATHRETIEQFKQNLIDIEDAVQVREEEIEKKLRDQEEEIALLKKELSMKNDRIENLENDVTEISKGLQKEVHEIRRIWDEDMNTRIPCNMIMSDFARLIRKSFLG